MFSLLPTYHTSPHAARPPLSPPTYRWKILQQRGLIAIDGDVDYLIEPLPSEGEGESDKMYLLHRRRANLRARSPVCGLVQRGSLSEQQWRHRTERAAVTERYVEIALVADRSMQDFYGSDLRNYLYTLMNMVRWGGGAWMFFLCAGINELVLPKPPQVSLLFKDSSLNTALNIVLVKLPPTGQNGGVRSEEFITSIISSGCAPRSLVGGICVWHRTGKCRKFLRVAKQLAKDPAKSRHCGTPNAPADMH